MTDRLDAHPEELLERERRGDALSAGEREMLAEHIGGCAVCRFSIQTAADFAREVPADVVPVARFDPLIQAALWSIRVATPGIRRRAWHRAPRVAAAASILLMAGAAAAAHWSGFLTTLEGRPASESPRVTRSAKAAPSPGARATPKILVAIEPPEPTAAPTPAATSAADERSAPPAPPARSAARWSASASAPTPAAVTRSSPSPIGPQGMPSGEPRWEALFAQAAAERAAGRPAAALRLYSELARIFPLSPEGKAARVIKGRLELDRGEAGTALSDFDGYLALGGGPLEEEALVGRAEALHGLARSTEEPAAWRRLIDKFPYSAHARRAAARIAELRAQP